MNSHHPLHTPRTLSSAMANSPLKIVSLAVTVILSAVTAWFYVPKAAMFLSSAVHPFCTTLQSWLNHLSIFLAINFIIFLIFRFSQRIDHHIHHYPHGGAASITGDKLKVEVDRFPPPIPDVAGNSSDAVVCKKKTEEDFNGVSQPISDIVENSSDEVVYRKNKADPPPVDSGTASDASCVTMKTEADGDEAQSSGENVDSMDATWQTIMANKDAPARRLTKSDTWERRVERADEAAVAMAPASAPEKKKEMKKSQTFKAGRRIPEALEEMDKKFDAFIQKNYDQMRRR